jgi:hypothetical protein
MFEVKINGGNDRINTGAIEKVLVRTFAEVLGEDVNVWVTQTDDHTLAVDLDRKDKDFPLVEDCLDPFAEGAEATAQADAMWDRAEARMQAEEDREGFKSRCPDALLPDGPTCPRCGRKRGPSGADGGSWVHIRK